MMKNKKQKGFSLIELILVLGLSSLAFISFVKWEVKKVQIAEAEIGGEQFAEVARALSSYIAREQVALNNNIPTGATSLMPLTVLQGISSGFYIGHQYLPSNFNPINIFKTNYIITIRNTLGRLDGLVTSSVPICEKGTSLACPSANNPVKYDWVGVAMRKIGNQSGMIIEGVPNVMSGYNAGWKLTSVDFPSITTSGILGVRVTTTDTSLYDEQYLRLDGTSVMLGNLNMGNFDIQNATNISYSGWISGFGVLANTINSGTINNTGSIQTANLFATTLVKSGANAVPGAVGVGDVQADRNITANNQITALQTVSTRDIFLGTTNANVIAASTASRSGRVVPNLWLSDLLPKYSSRGIYAVSDGQMVNKPNCGPSGNPKIEVIPQLTYTQGRVMGPITLIGGAMSGTTIAWDLYSYSPLAVWANNVGAQWQIRFQTPNYGPGSFVMRGLAHIYCDYQF